VTVAGCSLPGQVRLQGQITAVRLAALPQVALARQDFARCPVGELGDAAGGYFLEPDPEPGADLREIPQHVAQFQRQGFPVGVGDLALPVQDGIPSAELCVPLQDVPCPQHDPEPADMCGWHQLKDHRLT
jgi:hypothetical protein